MVIKRSSFGSARHWLSGHRLTMQRYLQKFYPPYDWGLIKHFFWENPIQARTILDDFAKNNDKKHEIIVKSLTEGKSKIIYVCGARGSGKSVLAFWLAEQINNKNPKIPIYTVGSNIIKKFPSWVKYAGAIQQVPNGSFIVLDEASIRYNAREFYREANILLGKYLAIARHKEISVIFITQHTALIDINITRLRDIIFWKRANDYSIGDKGRKVRSEDKFIQKIRNMMSPREQRQCLFEFPAQKRFINFHHPMPEFWTEELSKAFSSFNFDEKTKYEKKEMDVIEELINE